MLTGEEQVIDLTNVDNYM